MSQFLYGSAVRLLRCTSCVCPAVCLLHCICLCVCVSDAHGAHGPHLLRRPRRLLFCRRFALRSDRVPGSPSPNELLQLVATTDAHVMCSVCQCCRPPSIALGASWSPPVLRTHNLCLSPCCTCLHKSSEGDLFSDMLPQDMLPLLW